MSRPFNQAAKRGGKRMRSALGEVFHPVVQLPPAKPGGARVAPPKAAKFAPDPQRRVMVAKIQIAKKDLDFDDGDYRALLDRVTAKVSTTAMSIAELGQVLDELKRLGWAPRLAAGDKRAKPRPADHPAARKARAMLISLGLLGVIRNASEGALEAFARRQMGVDRLQWADQAQVYKLIEALKAIAERHGWEQSTAGLTDPIWTLKLRLCTAIIKRLVCVGALGEHATIGSVAASELGIEGPVMSLTERDLERLATHLGGLLAAYAHTAHYEGE